MRRSAAAGPAVGLADFSQAPPAIRTLIRVSYGDATGRIFLISAVVAAVAVVAIVFIREVALRTQSGEQRLRAEATTAEPRPTTARPPSGGRAVAPSLTRARRPG